MINFWPERHALLRALGARAVEVLATVDYPALSAELWDTSIGQPVSTHPSLRHWGRWSSPDILGSNVAQYVVVCGAHSEELRATEHAALALVIGDRVPEEPVWGYDLRDLFHLHVVPPRQALHLRITYQRSEVAGQIKVYGWRLTDDDYRMALAEGSRR